MAAKINAPDFRRLRGYAFDPSLSLRIDTANINQIIYKVRWEKDDFELKQEKSSYDSVIIEGLKPGPIGEYIEVIDYDPTVDKFYEPVDLNDNYLLAEDGKNPSESCPQFHQQMVYAVAMTTIQNFEKALGRKILWAPRYLKDKKKYEEYVQRLRIYPHALREANAYYSPQKKAILFGYFSSTPADPTLHMPGSLVFTCLSHDIIAHEVTHAILDGMQRYYNEPTNPDVLAFHEAFSDIVALFQHFSFPEVLKHQIAHTRGDLSSENLLGELAQEFGTAIGRYGSLRSAIGEKPEVNDYRSIMEPHKRGSILVATVFEAFINIYNRRVKDLLRIATNGTGVLPAGELHPDLVSRLANEASKSAKHVLNMCIRALDYCPPVDITFGDYLRAIITADTDLVGDDANNYRLAFIDAFRRRGIYPKGITTLSVESLKYESVEVEGELEILIKFLGEFLRDYSNSLIYEKNRAKIYNQTQSYIRGFLEDKDTNDNQEFENGLYYRVYEKFKNSKEFSQLTGMIFLHNWKDYGIRTSVKGGPSFQVQNLRILSRVGPSGNQINQIVFSIIQKIKLKIDENGKVQQRDKDNLENNKFSFRGGCTLIFDLDTLELKYVVKKPLLDLEKFKNENIEELYNGNIIDINRAQDQYYYQHELGPLSLTDYHRYFDLKLDDSIDEPFAILHQH